MRAAQLSDELNLFFNDVQVRGEYPEYMNRYFFECHIQIQMADDDEALLKQYTVDFISLSTSEMSKRTALFMSIKTIKGPGV